MKKLKFDHQLAELIRRGLKTTTWRLYDDKDISVNDTVELIDKVEPRNPETWTPFGIAQITAVVQKRLGDITPQDYEGHEAYTSSEEMLKTYRTYYGPQVDKNTPVKIIHFAFSEQSRKVDEGDVGSTSKITEIKLYADGGSRGNPGPSASGFAILDAHDQVVVKKGVYLGVTTNNQAEYQALKLGLEEALRMHARVVSVYMDSLLVVNQMSGIFKIKNRDLWPIHMAVEQLVPQFKRVSFTHVPRELNKIADAAVNEALDAALRRDV
ncbi:MAG TPA: reverse transcriptase-like protein [Candidatus Saccharimonadales bacterium]|nr:reverse transcriptase-like protein [Candidatus Saccharimonadales bacterium]